MRANDDAILMQDTIYYNAINAPDKVVTIAPDPAYAFTDFDTLMADPTKAVGGVRVAMEQSADTLPPSC